MNSKFKADHKLLPFDHFKFPLVIVSFFFASLFMLIPQMANRNVKDLVIQYIDSLLISFPLVLFT